MVHVGRAEIDMKTCRQIPDVNSKGYCKCDKVSPVYEVERRQPSEGLVVEGSRLQVWQSTCMRINSQMDGGVGSLE